MEFTSITLQVTLTTLLVTTKLILKTDLKSYPIRTIHRKCL